MSDVIRTYKDDNRVTCNFKDFNTKNTLVLIANINNITLSELTSRIVENYVKELVNKKLKFSDEEVI